MTINSDPIRDESKRRLIGKCFAKLHETMGVIEDVVETLGDPTASELESKMKDGLLSRMRKLRLHLGVGYDATDFIGVWNDDRE